MDRATPLQHSYFFPVQSAHVLPLATFVIHSSTTGVEFKSDSMTSKKLADLSSEIATQSAAMMGIYSRKLKLSESDVRKLVDRGDQDFNNWLTAEEALQIGLVTEIVPAKFDIFPDKK